MVAKAISLFPSAKTISNDVPAVKNRRPHSSLHSWNDKEQGTWFRHHWPPDKSRIHCCCNESFLVFIFRECWWWWQLRQQKWWKKEDNDSDKDDKWRLKNKNCSHAQCKVVTVFFVQLWHLWLLLNVKIDNQNSHSRTKLLLRIVEFFFSLWLLP